MNPAKFAEFKAAYVAQEFDEALLREWAPGTVIGTYSTAAARWVMRQCAKGCEIEANEVQASCQISARGTRAEVAESGFSRVSADWQSTSNDRSSAARSVKRLTAVDP